MTNLKAVLLPNHSYFFLPNPLLLYILVLYIRKTGRKKGYNTFFKRAFVAF